MTTTTTTTEPEPAVRKVRAPRGVVGQVRMAFGRGNSLAALVGCVFGGAVPFTAWWLAHYELNVRSLAVSLSAWLDPIVWLILGGLAFSAPTVYGWAKLTFRSPSKALGFVVLLEGTMLWASTWWLGVGILVLLVLVNGLAAACRVVESG